VTIHGRPRSAQLARNTGVAPHVHDRNRGHALPSGLTDEGYDRLRAAVDRRQATRKLVPQFEQPEPAPADPYERRRFASLEEVERAGFRRVAAGYYQEFGRRTAQAGGRVAHPIWELRQADGGEGYELVRRKEERAVDLRQGNAGAGTVAAVEAGIMRVAQKARHCEKCGLGLAKDQTTSSCPRCKGTGKYKDERVNNNPKTKKTSSVAIDPERDLRRRGGPQFLVSLLQVPGGDVASRRTLFVNEPMDLEGLERLVGELKPGAMTVTHDTWTDGEWEIRVRGPKGQLIHEYESVGPDEIGGAKGQTLLDALSAVLGGAGEEMPMPEGEEMPMPEGAEGALPPEAAGAPPEAAGLPAPGPIAPSAAALRRGQRIVCVQQGQVADAVVLMVRPSEQAVDVLFSGGGEGSVPMGDVLEPELDLDFGGGGDDSPPPDDGGGGDDALIEINSDDLGAGLGGAGNDPFEVSAHAFERWAAKKLAVELSGAFRPGAKLEVTHAFPSFFHGITFPEGTELEVEGFHQPDQDQFFGFPALPDPVPGGSQFDNLRIRLTAPNGQPLLVTLGELRDHFDMARGELTYPTFEDDTERYEELESVPMGEYDEDLPELGPEEFQSMPGVGRPTVPARPPAERQTSVSRPGRTPSRAPTELYDPARSPTLLRQPRGR